MYNETNKNNTGSEQIVLVVGLPHFRYLSAHYFNISFQRNGTIVLSYTYIFLIQCVIILDMIALY